MLQLLHIENIAVIERADISFRAGFNALTGETGAGKSIVIDSLGAVLGARTSRDLIRTGAAKAFVSAEFDGVDASLPVLAALGVEPEDGVLLLQRDIYADGKNICRANGRPITVAQLRALGTSLLNIHGQHEGTQLLDEEQHGAYLDRFARLDGLPEAYTERYQAARETRRQIEALEMDEAEKARRVDTLRHQIAELERAVVKQPRRARRQPRQDDEQPAFFADGRHAALRAGDEHHSPGHKQHYDRAQRRRQMRIDVLDADFGQNRRQRGEQRGQQRIHAPHTGPFFPMGFYRSHYITKR